MAIKILRVTDRVQVKIGEVTVSLAPLTMFQRQELLAHVEQSDGQDVNDIRKATVMALKYSVKDIEGIEDMDGNKYELSFGSDKCLTDDCVLELLNTEISDKMIHSSYSMIYGLPTEIKDHEGNKVEGVEVVVGKQQESANPQ